MEFKQLEAFVQVVKLGSFSKAAQALYLTQPTVSAHISSLEKELEQKLLLRTTKEVVPSEAGRTFYQYAREILELRSRAVQSLQRDKHQLQGTISIAASTIPRQCFLPELMAAFRKEYPQVVFSLLQGDSTQVAGYLSRREAEVGLVGTIVDSTHYVYQPFYRDKMLIVTPNTPAYQKLAGKPFPLERLMVEPFILRELGSGTRKETEDLLRGLGVEPEKIQVAAQIEDLESIKQSVSQGMGISIISQRAVEEFQRFGLVLTFELEQASLNRNLYVTYRKNKPLSPASQRFIDFVTHYYQQA